MGRPKRFTKEFEEEAVRLLRTSGRTRRQVADDLGVGLATLARWIAESKEPSTEGAQHRTKAMPSEGDMAAEIKRLRGENEILRQERDILKKATAFFAREGNR